MKRLNLGGTGTVGILGTYYLPSYCHRISTCGTYKLKIFNCPIFKFLSRRTQFAFILQLSFRNLRDYVGTGTVSAVTFTVLVGTGSGTYLGTYWLNLF